MKPETQYDTEPEKAKNYMSAEIKELTIQLQKQSEERLHQAQQRWDLKGIQGHRDAFETLTLPFCFFVV